MGDVDSQYQWCLFHHCGFPPAAAKVFGIQRDCDCFLGRACQPEVSYAIDMSYGKLVLETKR